MKAYRVDVVDTILVRHSIHINAETEEEAAEIARGIEQPPWEYECKKNGYTKCPELRQIVKVEKRSDSPITLLAGSSTLDQPPSEVASPFGDGHQPPSEVA